MEKIGRERRPGAKRTDELRLGTCTEAYTADGHRHLSIEMDDGEKVSIGTELIEAAFEVEAGDRVSLRGHRLPTLARVEA